MRGEEWNPLERKRDQDGTIPKVFQLCIFFSRQLAFHIDQYPFAPVENGASETFNYSLHLTLGGHMWSRASTKPGYRECNNFNIKSQDCLYIYAVIFGISFITAVIKLYII